MLGIGVEGEGELLIAFCELIQIKGMGEGVAAAVSGGDGSREIPQGEVIGVHGAMDGPVEGGACRQVGGG